MPACAACRERIKLLLDPGSPFLELSQLAGKGLYGERRTQQTTPLLCLPGSIALCFACHRRARFQSIAAPPLTCCLPLLLLLPPANRA